MPNDSIRKLENPEIVLTVVSEDSALKTTYERLDQQCEKSLQKVKARKKKRIHAT